MDSNHFQQASALVADARARLGRVEEKHQRSSPAPRPLRSIAGTREPDELVREVEVLARQLASALDLTAIALYLLYGKTVRGRVPLVVFPVLPLDEPAKGWSELLERTLPGVAAARPDVARALSKPQHTTSPDHTWLAILRSLSEAARQHRLRDRDELDRLMKGAPVVPMLRRMVQRTGQLVTELRGLTVLR